MDHGVTSLCDSVLTRPSPHPSPSAPWCHGNEYVHPTHRELLDFTIWLKPTDIERHARFLTINRFQTALSLLWPGAELICHGSTATATNLPMSDLDFVVLPAPDDLCAVTVLELLNDHFSR
jgi:DNA polymerase sigma